MRRIVRTIAVFLLALTAQGALAQPKIVVSPPDASVELTGDTGAATSTTRTLRLYVSEGEREVILDPTDLVDAERNTTIDRSQVQVKLDANAVRAPLALKAAQPTDIKISVSELRQPGVYRGKLLVRQADATKTPVMAAVEVPIALTIRYPSSTAVVAAPTSIVLHLTEGPDFLRFLSSRAGTVDALPIEFRGIAPPLPIASAHVGSLRGAQSAAEFPRDGCGDAPTAKCLSVARDGARALLSVDARRALPDRYTGNLTVVLTGLDKVIDVPLGVTIRMHPLYVLVAVVLGVLLGRGWKWVADKGKKIADADRRLTLFFVRLSTLSAEDQALFETVLRALERHYAMRDFSAFDTALEQAAGWADALDRLNQLMEVATNANNAAVLANLRRMRVRIGNDINIAQLKTDIEAAAAPLFTAAAAAPPAVARQRLMPAPRPSAGAPLAQRLRQNAFVANFVVPGFGALTIIALAFIGFEAVYIKSTGPFGANWVSDLLTALVWGLGADVAGRTLANLR